MDVLQSYEISHLMVSGHLPAHYFMLHGGNFQFEFINHVIHVMPIPITLNNAHLVNFVAYTKEQPLLKKVLNCVRFILVCV